MFPWAVIPVTESTGRRYRASLLAADPGTDKDTHL